MPEAEDKAILGEILLSIEYEMAKIVDKKNLFRKEFRETVAKPWPTMRSRLETARGQLKEVKWDYIEGVGLAGEELAWKRDNLKTAIQHRLLGTFLKLVNSILGSLSGAIPILEGIKEYKEHVEAAVEKLDTTY
jgi:hypothetical protein